MTDAATEVHQIHPGLVEFAHPIGELRGHPNNPRIGNVDAIAESLKENGQMKPIVARTDGTICAGNHSWKAAQKLGWTHIAVLLLDMTDDEEQRYLLADNRASDLADYDLSVLQPILQELSDAGKLAGTGFTADDVDDLTAAIGKVADSSTPGADHIEPKEETAGRYVASSEQQGGLPITPGKEVQFMFTEEAFDLFATNLRALKKAWGIEASRDVVAEAIRRAAVDPGHDPGVAVEAAAPEPTPEG